MSLLENRGGTTCSSQQLELWLTLEQELLLSVETCAVTPAVVTSHGSFNRTGSRGCAKTTQAQNTLLQMKSKRAVAGGDVVQTPHLQILVLKLKLQKRLYLIQE